jgi:hypothetical protein
MRKRQGPVAQEPEKAISSLDSGGGAHPPAGEQRVSEIERCLKDEGKLGLLSLIEGARWEFGESEVRLRPAAPGIAEIIADADRQTLEQAVSRILGRRMKVLIGDGPQEARMSGAGKASAKLSAAPDPSAEAEVRNDPEVREFERTFGKPVTGIRKWKR